MFLNSLAIFLSYHIWRPFCSHHSQAKRAIRYTSCRKSPTSRYFPDIAECHLFQTYARSINLSLPGLGKVRQTCICIAPRREHTSRRSGMARVLKGSHSFTCTPRVHPLMEWTIPAFSFPAEAGPHLLTPDGWKAVLAWGREPVRPLNTLLDKSYKYIVITVKLLTNSGIRYPGIAIPTVN